MILEHPEIEWALATGYPSWAQDCDEDGFDDDWEDRDDLEDYYD